MKRYIYLLIGNKPYRFLLNDSLERKLKSILKEKYEIDRHDYLVMDALTLEEKYEVKQALFQDVLMELQRTNLTEKEKIQFESLQETINSKKSRVYHSDLTRLESALNDLGELFAATRNRVTKEELRKEPNIEKKLDTKTDSDNTITSKNTNSKNNNEENDLDLTEIKELLNEIEENPELKREVPTTTIKEIIDKIKVCNSKEEYESLTGLKAENFRVEGLNFDRVESVILPPAVSVSEVFVEALNSYCSSSTITKVVEFTQNKDSFTKSVQDAFEHLRSEMKVKGMNTRNLNYFGDNFLDQLDKICRASGMSMETMFEDYFNGYDANRKYNSALDRFIRQFIKYNGGDDNTRKILEALIVKKAVSRHLISTKYNRYLSDEYRYTEVTGGGYVKFDSRKEPIIKNKLKEEKAIQVETQVGSSVFTSSIGTNKIQEQQKIQASFNGNEIKNNENIINAPKGGIDGVNPHLAFRANNESSNKLKEKKSSEKEKNYDIPTNLSLNQGIKKGTEREEASSTSLASVAAIQQINRIKKGMAGNIGVIGEQQEYFGIGMKKGITSTSESVLSPLESSHKNNHFNQYIHSELENEDNKMSEENMESDLGDNQNNDINASNTNNPGALPPDNIDSNNSDANNSGENATKNLAKKSVGAFLKKHKLLMIGIGIGCLFLLLLVAIFGGSSDMNNGNMGYFDEACNYNNVNVTLTSCDGNTDLLNTSLDDFVLKMTYLYTKNKNYDDEVIKAMMIVLKTNTLSYGNYTSGTNNIEVSVCKLKEDYDETEEDPFAGFDKSEENLSELYETIKEYLYISSSYRSSISSLSSRNALDFNTSKLEEFALLNSAYDSILSSSYKTDNEEEETIYRETLFIGDSRTHGMNLGVNEVNDNNSVYGTGKGYKWFINEETASSGTNAPDGGLKEARTKIKDNVPYNIIIWLGVNDLGNLENYFNKYQELALNEWKNHELYVVSVGPVNDETSSSLKNNAINNFNLTMEEFINNANISNLHFLDLNITEEDISFASDGLHYEASAYQKIYEIIMNNIDTSISGNLKLYKLTDYCTYYNLTDNVAYWWPVGSANPTISDIYGGTPTSTIITSGFGKRDINVEGSSKNHAGIDIAKNGNACGDVVIASRSGIVVTATDNGGARGTYVVIDHGDGIKTLYQHMQGHSYTVKVGDQVKQGQKIGLIGNTGVSGGCHLHFEVWVNNKPVNPVDYVDKDNPRPVKASFNGVKEGADASENKSLVCHALLNSGYSENAVAGMLVNIQAEGSFRTNNLENCYEENECCNIDGRKYGFCVHNEIAGFGSDDGYTNGVDSGAYPREKFIYDRAGYGLIQWTSSGRKAGLYDLAKSKNKSIASLGIQLEYLLQEIDNPNYSITKKYIEDGTASAYNIAVVFCKNFESPSGADTKNLTSKDSCTVRADNNLASMLEYVNNGCQ